MIQARSLQIRGMTCAACAQASERAVKKVAGIEEAAVNFATERLAVRFDDDVASLDAIVAAVARAGYEAVEDKVEKDVIIPVGGMTCAACVRAIERAVSRVAGVTSVSVNLATEKALVRYEPGTARLSQIKQAIVKAGYTPLAVDSGARMDEHKKAKEREIRVLWAKFAVSASFSLPLLYIAMGGMLGWPLPAGLAPMDYPLRYALLELALVLPAPTAGHASTSWASPSAPARMSPWRARTWSSCART